MVIFPNLFVGRKKLWTFIFLRKKIIIISGQTPPSSFLVFIKFVCKLLFNLLNFLAGRKFGIWTGNWAGFVRIEAAACGLRADCGAVSAPWYNPGMRRKLG